MRGRDRAHLAHLERKLHLLPWDASVIVMMMHHVFHHPARRGAHTSFPWPFFPWSDFLIYIHAPFCVLGCPSLLGFDTRYPCSGPQQRVVLKPSDRYATPITILPLPTSYPTETPGPTFFHARPTSLVDGINPSCPSALVLLVSNRTRGRRVEITWTWVSARVG